MEQKEKIKLRQYRKTSGFDELDVHGTVLIRKCPRPIQLNSESLA